MTVRAPPPFQNAAPLLQQVSLNRGGLLPARVGVDRCMGRRGRNSFDRKARRKRFRRQWNAAGGGQVGVEEAYEPAGVLFPLGQKALILFWPRNHPQLPR